MMRNLARLLAAIVTAFAIGAFLTLDWGQINPWVIVGGACAAVGVWVAHEWVLLGRDLDNAVEDIGRGIDIDRHCSVNGHAFCHPELHDGRRVWRCENCSEEVESEPGWIDGRSAS